MSRPSQSSDRRLIAAARRLFPETGCRGLNLRQVAAKAKVNLGMFHYHFKTKDEFLRRVLQEFYEEFFKELELEAAHYATPRENLRAALLVFSTFVRDNRRFGFALMRDAMCGEKIAEDFLRANLHRHIEIIVRLIRQCQAQGQLKELPPANALITLLTGMNFPSVLSELVRRAPNWPEKKIVYDVLENDVLSDAALAARIDFLLGEAP